MAASFVQLPDDSTNVGKKVRSKTRTVGTDIVHEHLLQITDASADVQATVMTSTPAGTEGAIVTRNIPSGTQPVSAAALPLPTGASTEATLSTLNGKVTACNTGAVVVTTMPTTAVTGTFFQATQPISAASLPLPTGAALDATLTGGTQKAIIRTATKGTSTGADCTSAATDANTQSLHVNVVNLPATQPISAAALPLPTGASTEATLSTLNGKVTACNTGAVVVTTMPTTAVTGTFFQATQPISAASLPLPTGASLDATLTGGTQKAIVRTATKGTSTGADCTSAATDANTQALHTNVVNFPATQAVTGTFFQGTQPVSAAALPLPTGASTEATLSTLNGKVTACNTGAVVVTTMPTTAVTGTFFQATQPVSAASLPLPTGAAADATLTGGTVKVINRGGAKGSTTAADVTSVSVDANTQSLHTSVTNFPATQPVSQGTAATTTPWITRITNSDGSIASIIQPYGVLRVSPEPTTLFYDPFDSALDTTNRWNATGTAVPTTTLGTTSLTTGTTASATSYLTSQPTFNAAVPAFLQHSWLTKFDAVGAAVTQAYRFMGMGIAPGSPTQAAPMQDGYGIVIDTDGKMYFDVWANSVRISRTDMSSTGTGTAQSKQPLDGAWHRYIVQYRTDRLYIFLDTLDTPIITLITQTPTIQTLPIKAMVINGAVQTTAPIFQIEGIAAADTGRNSSTLCDGTFAWRKINVSAAGALKVDGSASVQPITAPTLTKATQSANGFSVQDLKDSGRSQICFQADRVAGIATEALITTLSKTVDGVATASITTYSITSGKRFRIQNIHASFLQSSATGLTCQIRLRWNPSGTALVSSPVVYAIDMGLPVGTIAQGHQSQPFFADFPDGLEFPTGGSIAISQITKTAAGVGTAGGTMTINMIGYEY